MFVTIVTAILWIRLVKPLFIAFPQYIKLFQKAAHPKDYIRVVLQEMHSLIQVQLKMNSKNQSENDS